MKKILILGAGMVVKPIVTYLLDKGYYVTVATRTKSKAEAMIGTHSNGAAVAWNVDDEQALGAMIAAHDLTVSLLPWVHHITVAEHCIRHKKNMITTSYVKPAMQALDSAAREAGIIILNELGLDPGIDHMSAMRIIDNVHEKGGKIEEFYSICGALPSPEAATNPFKYKFSWSPKGVVMAGNNDGNYLRHGKKVYVPTEDLFKNPLKANFPGVGVLDIYPNRDSMPYIGLYGIPETSTMMRGTFRYPGWCESLDAMKALRLITSDQHDFNGKTYADFVSIMMGADNSRDIRRKSAAYLKLDENAHAIDAIEWLGLFSNEPMNRGLDTPFEITSDLMIAKMELGREERDMVAMQHVFVASYPDIKSEVIKSSMLDFGTIATDTAIARTVALPAAIGVEMILKGEITETGVHIPVLPGIYNPILDRLEDMNIRMVEEYGLPLSEVIS
ncbi:MAG: saccharopine dehydrogenase C-terminal domain-containing protein [Bacteroidales bacterium]|nr:saccharopine dehydrogenase C-terminal domain-containing protein [Bacteroidales bacterium]MDZ4205529.1 saccharopine dehydrogenase C-terminal domain-containing protein [Bacteroidales bacterium]